MGCGASTAKPAEPDKKPVQAPEPVAAAPAAAAPEPAKEEAATAPGVRVGLRPKPDGAEAAEPPEPDQD